tara:strand:- start:3010 stop:3363 length:354 start_codon:yes stop_codon:yes gene_type:complete
MSIIIGLITAVALTFHVQPTWFEDGQHTIASHHFSLEDCQTAKNNSFSYTDGELVKNGDTGVCVNSLREGEQANAVDLYLLNDAISGKLIDMTWVECDYWAGCYFGTYEAEKSDVVG